MVDMKLAFEGGADTKSAFIEVPEFMPPSSLWLPDPDGEAHDIFRSSCTANKWCYLRSCTSNAYIESQKKQRKNIESEIDLIFEEYEAEKQQGNDGVDRFKQLMEDKDVLRLLPGTVPGFALRNRRWCKCFL